MENLFLTKVDLDTMQCSPSSLIGQSWFLLTAGTPEDYNMMTAGWGAIGEIWAVPTLHCFVRTNRYTLEFLEKYDTFTASFFDPGYKPMLSYCGSHSGRDVNKLEHTNLRPAILDGGVAFAQARRVMICKKMYIGDMQKEGFVDPAVYEKFYAEDNPMHREVIGEIVSYYERLY